jgi:hypothetical protein
MNFLNPQEIASVCSKPRKDEPKPQSRRQSNSEGLGKVNLLLRSITSSTLP